MKIVFLDAESLGSDADYSEFEQLGDVVKYPRTSPEEVPERIADADVIVVNKVPVNEATISDARSLKLICVSATGTNNLDKDYLKHRGIEWRNAAGYSTESVAQHTFAMLFYLMEDLRYYDDYVKNGSYASSSLFTHFGIPFHELGSVTWGILGLGAIGRRVADIAGMFGAKVIYYSASGSPAQEGYRQVDFDTLLAESDILSIHAPLNEYTENIMNADAFRKMKSDAILLNLGRGPIINEADLADALNSGEIRAAGLDVLSVEPMVKNSPLFEVHDKTKLFITPHVAWAAVEARQRLMKIVAGQIKEYFGRA
ncbi:MAG TPA: D-2-hydroxyacid dehydrogenase [Candidatus Mediterraneibacter gallistercoris]|uniref:D-2-hydroxyacid dehydrogenase n=1 Tax=Candidatus Mediterraneibacter gallistercoris TaxID=2838671 RepID=A0A9D2P3F8_9FIRM|nr:D-2-hydroxyacid dehydrogenase [Candidatus Mediterraneibacter gallistercoris]